MKTTKIQRNKSTLSYDNSKSTWPLLIKYLNIFFSLQNCKMSKNHPFGVIQRNVRFNNEVNTDWQFTSFTWGMNIYSQVSNKSTRVLTHFEVFAPPWSHLFHPDRLLISDILPHPACLFHSCSLITSSRFSTLHA